MLRKVTKRMTWISGWSSNPRRMNIVTDELFQALSGDMFLMNQKDKTQTWDNKNNPQYRRCLRGGQSILGGYRDL